MNIKAAFLAISICAIPKLLCQEAAPTIPSNPISVTAEGIAEIEKANANGKAWNNPARNWIAGESKNIVVTFDEKMSWAMQTRMYASSTRSKYLKNGIHLLIVCNGKKAWKVELDKGSKPEEFLTTIPLPTINADSPLIAHLLPKINSYNEVIVKNQQSK